VTDADEAEAIARFVLPQYGIPAEAPLRLLSVSENATYATSSTGSTSSPRSTGSSTDGGVVLRVCRPGYHSRTSLESELAWIEAVRADGVLATPAVLTTRAGQRVATARPPRGGRGPDRHVIAFERVDGAEPGEGDLRPLFAELGGLAARLHEHARRWRRPPWFTRLRWDVDGAIGEYGHWGRWLDGVGVGPAEREALGRAADVVASRLRAYGDGPDRFGLVHADMRLANLLVDPVRARTNVIDFDDCGFGWFGYDLAASLSFIEQDPAVPELMAAWASGYRAVAPLPGEDEAELPTFVMLRRLLLVAWIGSHSRTDLAASMGEDYTRMSCDLAEAFLRHRG